VEKHRFKPTLPLFGAPVGVTPLEFRRGLWRQNTVPGLSYGVVCVILRLAVLAQRRLATDGRTDERTRQTDT